MSTRIMEIRTDSAQATEEFACRLGSRLLGGEVIELIGDVGAGKTTFVRGLAKGVGSEDRVSSPTFTVSQVYQAGDKKLHHFDFYRINDYEIIKRELAEVAADPQSIAVMEWAEDVADQVPGDRIRVSFSVTGEDARKLTISVPDKYTYLEELK